jgi:putative hydrolase of the HAD superfamily
MVLRVVLDLDDTLYRERDYALGGFRAASRHLERAYGAPDTSAEMERLLDEGHLGQLFRIVLERLRPAHSKQEMADLLAAYASHSPELTLFDDAVVLLDEIARRGCPAGLITDGHHPTQARKVEALGIGSRFDHIVYTGQLGPGREFHKPHPRAFQMIQQAMGGANDRFVYVGDNPAKDFIAPNALGWTTVMVQRPHEQATRIHKTIAPTPQAAPAIVVASLCEVPGHLWP